MSLCDGCHAGCCRAFAVPVTGADILRIERNLGLDFWDFVCRWSDPTGAIAAHYAPHFYFEDEPETPFVISLTHAASKYFSGTTKCRFLTECEPDEEHPLGQARCGIYGSRPQACRVFPTKFNDSCELALIHDIPDWTREDEHPVYELCPRQWLPEDLDPVQPLHDLVVAKFEMQLFRNLATVWNETPRPWNLFPNFLHMIYEKRVMLEPQASPDVIPFVAVPSQQGRRAA